jgi:hypothetical protein
MGPVHRGAWTQNRENNPMQSRMGTGTRAALRPGHEKKNGRGVAAGDVIGPVTALARMPRMK